MKRMLMLGIAAAALLLPPVLSAQTEVLPEAEKVRLEEMLPGLAGKTSGFLAEHLKKARKKSRAERINASRVAQDFEKSAGTERVLHYCVPAMSETQYLPDVYPFDGEAGVPLRIVAAQDEYEPGSFVLYPLVSLGKTAFEVGELKMPDGTVFPAADLDLKTVKVWYQNGSGWYSYFLDSGLKLCPELLLNDEDLIKVDTRKTANYARLTEKDGSVSFRLLTVPKDLNYNFSCMKPNFQDSAKFMGATLNEGEFKQFFLTAHVRTGQKPGLYSGGITLKKDGKAVGRIPVQLRVLPFVLPKPMTYHDPDKEFRDFTSAYVSLQNIRYLNGNDGKLAEKQLAAILKNFAEHGQKGPNYDERVLHPEYAEAAGLDTSVFIAGSMKLSNVSEMRFDARRKAEMFTKKFGTHTRHYLDWNDEFGFRLLRAVRPMIAVYAEAGFRYTCNSPGAYVFGMYMTDFYRVPVRPDFSTNRLADKVGFIQGDGQYFGWYAMQHVGVENPAFCRRQYGLGPYRAGFSCNRNYAHHLDGYNDLAGHYKPMNFIYGDGKGAIDTLSWEGFREGIDDIRYATLLQKLARPLAESRNYRAKYAARKALQYLADMNTDSFDLSAARLEMIRHILTLQSFGK